MLFAYHKLVVTVAEDGGLLRSIQESRGASIVSVSEYPHASCYLYLTVSIEGMEAGDKLCIHYHEADGED